MWGRDVLKGARRGLIEKIKFVYIVRRGILFRTEKRVINKKEGEMSYVKVVNCFPTDDGTDLG